MRFDYQKEKRDLLKVLKKMEESLFILEKLIIHNEYNDDLRNMRNRVIHNIKAIKDKYAESLQGGDNQGNS